MSGLRTLVGVLGLVGLVLTAFVLRVIVIGKIGVIEPDGAFYGRLAQLAIRNSGDRAFHPAWPPGYPASIAAMSKLLGAAGPWFGDAGGPVDSPLAIERAARLASALAGSLLLVPVFLVARRLGGARMGWIAALLVLAHPALLRMSAQALTESTFTLLFVTVLALLGTQRAELPSAAAAGLAGAGAILTRPEAFLLLAGGGIFLLRCRRRAAAVTFVAVAGLAASPYLAYVSESVGHLSAGAKGDYNLAVAYAGAPGVVAFDRTASTYNNLTGAPPQGGFPESIPRFGLASFLVRHPTRVAQHALHQIPAAASALFSLGNAIAGGLALVGLWRRRRTIQREEVAWLSLWGGYVALYSIVFVYRRFFAPFVPLLLVEAAGALALPASRRVVSGRLAGAVVAAGLALIGVSIVLRNGSPEPPALEQRRLGQSLHEMTRQSPSPATAGLEGVMARRPWVAWYADRPILAMAEGGAKEIAAAARARGARWVVIDSRDLARERPSLAALASLSPGESLPPGWRQVSYEAEGENQAALYEVAPPNGP